MKKFVKLENEFGDVTIERIDRIKSIQSLKGNNGVRIWWNEDEEGIDYLTSFGTIANHLEVN